MCTHTFDASSINSVLYAPSAARTAVTLRHGTKLICCAATTHRHRVAHDRPFLMDDGFALCFPAGHADNNRTGKKTKYNIYKCTRTVLHGEWSGNTAGAIYRAIILIFVIKTDRTDARVVPYRRTKWTASAHNRL